MTRNARSGPANELRVVTEELARAKAEISNATAALRRCYHVLTGDICVPNGHGQ